MPYQKIIQRPQLTTPFGYKMHMPMRAAHWAALCEEQEELTCMRACVECEHLLGSSGSTSRFSCMHTDATQSHTHNFLLAPSIGRLNEPPTDTLTNCTQTHTTIHIYSSYHSAAQRAAYIYIYMRLNEPPTDTLTNCTQTHTTIHIYSSYHSVAQRAAYIYIYMCGSMSRQRIRSGTVHKHTQLYTYIAHTIQRPNEPPIYIYICVFCLLYCFWQLSEPPKG